MGTVKERLKQFIDYKGFSERKFSKKISSSPTYFTSTKTIGSDKLEKINKEFPELNMHWVISGEGEMIYNELNQKPKNMKLEFGKFVKNIMEFHSITKEQLLKSGEGIFDEERLNTVLLYVNQIDITIIFYLDKLTGEYYEGALGFTKNSSYTEEDRIVIVDLMNQLLERHINIPTIKYEGIEQSPAKTIEMLQKALEYGDDQRKK